MTVILFHQGCKGPFIDGTAPPNYLGDCLKQYSIFNKEKIYFLTDRVNINALAKYPQVIPVALEDYYSDKIARLVTLYKYPERNFWTVSLVRFAYIENFMRQRDLKHVYHLENDVLLYFDIAKYHETFKQLYKNLAITPGGPDKCMTGFMYIDNYQALERMTDFFINILAKLSENEIRSVYGCDMVHEMSLMAAYRKESPEHMVCLPTLPFGYFSKHFDRFNAVFDPATYGQFVGGSRTEGPGIIPQDHYIGNLLEENPQYGVKWVIEDGLKVPYFSYAGNLAKINNLHIHSKNLKAYMSKDANLEITKL